MPKAVRKKNQPNRLKFFFSSNAKCSIATARARIASGNELIEHHNWRQMPLKLVGCYFILSFTFNFLCLCICMTVVFFSFCAMTIIGWYQPPPLVCIAIHMKNGKWNPAISFVHLNLFIESLRMAFAWFGQRKWRGSGVIIDKNKFWFVHIHT